MSVPSKQALCKSMIYLGIVLVLCSISKSSIAASPYFRITVVDNETSRGIPCVRLRTMDHDEFWTDSRGVVAFNEPGLMDRNVYFILETYGYSLPLDAMGNQGVLLKPVADGGAIIRMNRQNVAQRLYRVTGVDQYADSKLLGDTVPTVQDSAAIQVMGQDSVVTAVFKNKMYWLWGDTGVSNYALGNFRTTGATSLLPGQGGLDPEVGVSYTYFREQNGNVKKMANIDNTNLLVWSNAMRVVTDGNSAEVLLGNYTKVQGLTTMERGFMRFNETTQIFDKVQVVPLNAVIFPSGAPIRYTDKGNDYYYYSHPWVAMRTRTDLASNLDASTYEAFTCLKAGTIYDANTVSTGDVERDAQNNVVWGWKKNTSPIGETEMARMVSRGAIAASERFFSLKDIETGKVPDSHSGSIGYNEYRKRWIAIVHLIWGDSFLGEVWLCEGDTPLGPWAYGRKIVTHSMPGQTYSFYNILQHPEFHKEGGRVVFFEGTYTSWLSNTDHVTPQYDYNQMMYKVEMDDPRLFLPVPVYRTEGAAPALYRTKEDLSETETNRTIVCFAPDRPRANTIPIYEKLDLATNSVVLTASAAGARHTAFYAVSPATPLSTTDLAMTVPLYEFTPSAGGARIYSTEGAIAGYQRASQPLCRVWPNPVKFNPYKLMN